MQDDTIEDVVLYLSGLTSIRGKVTTGILHFMHEAELVAHRGNERIHVLLEWFDRFGGRLAMRLSGRQIYETTS